MVTVDNDPEARMIRLLAEHAGIAMIVSQQEYGARLELEPNIGLCIRLAGKKTVCTVEIPGPEIEADLVRRGFVVKCIDHHDYGTDLKRSRGPDGKHLPSSLEQFLAFFEITDAEMLSWGWNPHTVRGLGIFDDRYVQGLRDEGYQHEQIDAVIGLRNSFMLELDPSFMENYRAAATLWVQKDYLGPYILIVSPHEQSVRANIGLLSIGDGLDTQPIIVSDRGGQEVFVQNVDPETVTGLQEAFGSDKTFTFGAGRCWGVNNGKGNGPAASLDQILQHLIA